MDLLRKLTAVCAIVGAATFSGVLLTGCDEGYEAEEIEGLEGIEQGGEELGEGVGEGVEDLGEGVEDTAGDLGNDLNNDVIE